jgi:hypothetical protein
MTEFGIFNDEGCVERGLYSAVEAQARVKTYDSDDDVAVGIMCHCGDPGCECEVDNCDCVVDDEDDDYEEDDENMTTTLNIDPERLALPDSALAHLHRAELIEVREDRRELDHLTEEHRLEWAYRADHRPKAFDDSDVVLVTQHGESVVVSVSPENAPKPRRSFSASTKAPEPVKVPLVPKTNQCVDCSAVIPPTGKKGRPPKRCVDCREAFDKESTTGATVSKPRGWNLKKGAK